MQRKLTPLQRLRKEFPYVRDTVLQNELDRVGGDIKLAVEQLKPPGLNHSAIPKLRNPSESPKTRSNGIIMSNYGSFSSVGNQQATSVIATPSIVECACCIDDIPIAEATFCSNSQTPHRFCLTCAKRYAEEEIGKTKFKLVCFDSSGCASPFSDKEIKRFLDKRTFEFLEKLKIADELKEAGLEGLVHCPFCSFAAIMEDPTDRIFACLSCGVSSCRYCRVKSHHPVSCEKYQADKKLCAKHLVEEAMTDALVRKCNSCKKPFLKEEGCNKMKCSCGNEQCYVCSEDVTDYSHFGDEEFGQCPMHGDIQDQLRRDVAKAEEATVQQLLRDRAELKDEDVRVNKNTDRGDRETEGGFLESSMTDITFEQPLWFPEPVNEVANRELYEVAPPFYYAPFERPQPREASQFAEPPPRPPLPARWPLPPLYWPEQFTYPLPPPPLYVDERPGQQQTNIILEDAPTTYRTIREPVFPAPTYLEDEFDNRSAADSSRPRRRGQKTPRPTSDWQLPPPPPLPPVPVTLPWTWLHDQPNYSRLGRPGEPSTSAAPFIPKVEDKPYIPDDIYTHPRMMPNGPTLAPSNQGRPENTEQKQKSLAGRKLTRKSWSRSHRTSNNNFKSNNPFLKPQHPNVSRNPYDQLHAVIDLT